MISSPSKMLPCCIILSSIQNYEQVGHGFRFPPWAVAVYSECSGRKTMRPSSLLFVKKKNNCIVMDIFRSSLESGPRPETAEFIPKQIPKSSSRHGCLSRMSKNGRIILQVRLQTSMNKAKQKESKNQLHIFSRVHATLQPALSVRPSVGWSVGHVLLFLWFYFFDLTATA